jgi:methylenetetrahydrofolate reductase (NADPH)
MIKDFSFETVARRAGELADVRDLLPPGTRVSIPHLGGDDLAALAGAAHAVREMGFVPVPHLAARRLEAGVDLTVLRAATDQLFVVGGDPARPEGPFPDGLALIRSGLLAGHGFRSVGLPAYPSGHPAIDDERLWADLAAKAAALTEQGLAAGVTLQFAGRAAVANWLAESWRRGIDLPVRVSVPGAGGIPSALAARLGLDAQEGGLLGFPAGVKLHLSPFGAVRETARLATARAAAGSAVTGHSDSTGCPQFRHTVSVAGRAMVPA